MIDFTTCVAIDEQHAAEFAKVWPTWARHKPEIMRKPFVLLVDDVLLSNRGLSQASDFLTAHKNCRVIPVTAIKGINDQREKMLTALTLAAPWYVHTPWILKLDTDTVAYRKDDTWCGDDLIEPVLEPSSTSSLGQFRECVFAASGWGYTKPADAVKRLDDWADKQPALLGTLRLNLPFDPNGLAVTTPGRIISWCFFGNTKWIRWAASLCGRLPVPSHDTYLWYLAARTRAGFRSTRMHRRGWGHVRARRLDEEVKKAMSQ